MEILKEITQWDVDYRQPNHTYLVNSRNQIIAYAKWHSQKDIHLQKSKMELNRRYRKFIKVSHSELSKIEKQFQDEKEYKKEPVKRVATENVRLFKVKSKTKDKTYVVEYNVVGKFLSCGCVGFGYRRKCSHTAAVANKIGV